jgi:hypothetical protein
MEPLKGRFLPKTANIRIRQIRLGKIYNSELLITVVKRYVVQTLNLI